MRNIEKEKQERVNKTEESLEYLTKLGNALSNIATCIEEAITTKERIKEAKTRIAPKQNNPLANKVKKLEGLKGEKRITTAKDQMDKNLIINGGRND